MSRPKDRRLILAFQQIGAAASSPTFAERPARSGQPLPNIFEISPNLMGGLPRPQTAPIKIIHAQPRLLQIAAFNIVTKC